MKSSCPASGVKYLPKNGGSSPTSVPTTTGGPGPTPTAVPGTPFSGRGFLNVNVNGAKKGCIISAGTWYTSGTCATITATSAGDGFSLSSSKGKCGVVTGAFTCGGSVTTATAFTNSDGKLAAGGNAVWSADKVASGTTQEKVYAGADHATKLEIVWQSV
jgi:ribonuclease T2